jgi:hypothetical protein
LIPLAEAQITARVTHGRDRSVDPRGALVPHHAIQTFLVICGQLAVMSAPYRTPALLADHYDEHDQPIRGGEQVRPGNVGDQL